MQLAPQVRMELMAQLVLPVLPVLPVLSVPTERTEPTVRPEPQVRPELLAQLVPPVLPVPLERTEPTARPEPQVRPEQQARRDCSAQSRSLPGTLWARQASVTTLRRQFQRRPAQLESFSSGEAQL